MMKLKAVETMACVLFAATPFGCARWAGPNNTSASVYRSGGVGIRTSMPGAKLDVRGDVKLGSDGKSYAASSRESLRIVRGVVRKDGTIFQAEGFSVNKTSVGRYEIIFEPPFGGYPSTVASIDNPDPPSGMIRVVNFNSKNKMHVITMSRLGPGGESEISEDRGFSFIAVGPRE